MNPNNIIAQYPDSIALSFSIYGYPGPVNAHTLQAMIDLYGEPYLETLEAIINKQLSYAGYDAGLIKTYKMAPLDSNIDYETGGIKPIIDDGGGTLFQNPLPSYDIPPTIELPGSKPCDPTIDKNCISSLQSDVMPALYTPIPIEDEVAVSNGMVPPAAPLQSTETGVVNTMLPDTTVTAATTAAEPGKESFWKKYQTAIIVVIIIAALVLLSRKSAPVIIK